MKIENEPAATPLGGTTPRGEDYTKKHLRVHFVLGSDGIKS
jgi:hypothetical protein